jgi:bifunctional non-homologous end joining protein LigD
MAARGRRGLDSCESCAILTTRMPRISLSRPVFVEPMLPTLVDAPPEGGDWIHEIKYDGYRTVLAIDGAATRAFTRSGLDWSARYAPLVHEAAGLRCGTAILDGEVVVEDERGVTDFSVLRGAIRSAPERLLFIAFDCLMLDGADLRRRPLAERRDRLAALLGGGGERLRFSEGLAGRGPAVLAAAERLGLEGIVSKRADGRYQSGRTRSWLKAKTFEVGAFDILGIETSPTGRPVALLATPGPAPRYVGNAVIPLPEAERSRFFERIERLGTPRARLMALHRRKARWLKPGLTATVRHMRGEEALRHATVLSLDGIAELP